MDFPLSKAQELFLYQGRYTLGSATIPTSLDDPDTINALIDEHINILKAADDPENPGEKMVPDETKSNQEITAILSLIASNAIAKAGDSMLGALGLKVGTSLAASTTLTPDNSGNYYVVTGDDQIENIHSDTRGPFFTEFAGSPNLKQSATLGTPAGEDYPAVPGDILLWNKVGSAFKCIGGLRASGRAFKPEVLPYRTEAASIQNNAASPNTHLDFIAGGYQANDGNTIVVPATVTKRIDQVWAAGAGNGALATGAVAVDETYHCFAMQKADGTVDYLVDLTVNAGDIPSGYIRYAYVGSINTDSSAYIVPFTQRNDLFEWVTPTLDVNQSLTASTRSLIAINVPTGIPCEARVRVTVATNNLHVSSPDTDAVNPSTSSAPLTASGEVSVLTDTLGRLAFQSDGSPNLKASTQSYRNMKISLGPLIQ